MIFSRLRNMIYGSKLLVEPHKRAADNPILNFSFEYLLPTQMNDVVRRLQQSSMNLILIKLRRQSEPCSSTVRTTAQALAATDQVPTANACLFCAQWEEPANCTSSGVLDCKLAVGNILIITCRSKICTFFWKVNISFKTLSKIFVELAPLNNESAF